MFDEGVLPKDDFSPALIDALTFDGNIWTVPFDNYGVGVYVNLDLLEQAGIDPNAAAAECGTVARICAQAYHRQERHPSG